MSAKILPFWVSPFLSFFFVLVLTFVMDQNAKINRPIWEVLSKSRNVTKFESESLKNVRRYKKILKVARFIDVFTAVGKVVPPAISEFRDFAELYLPSFQTNHSYLI